MTDIMYKLNNKNKNDDNKQFYFLGIIHKRYVQTYIGSLHALSSLLALFIGNYLFVRCIVLGQYDDDVIVDDDNNNNLFKNNNDTLITLFHISTLLSGLTLLPFWNKVQSWQLSTTSMSEKGLSSQQMQNFNRGRGVLCMILSPLYPLVYRFASNELLQNVLFTKIVSGLVALVCWYQYTLIRDYGKVLFIIYGGSRLGFSLHALLSRGSTLYTLTQDTYYPYALTYLEKEAILVVSCVEFGFLWYYLHSRKLVSKEFVQEACKRYHPTLFFTWIVRLSVSDAWYKHLPMSISWVMIMNTLLAALFLTKMFRKSPSVVNEEDQSLQEKSVAAANNKGGDRRNALRRSSSIFDVHNSRTRRRSSIFESITE